MTEPNENLIVLDVGKKKPKAIKQLKRGEGPLTDEVTQAIEQVRSRAGNGVGTKPVIPVVILYRKEPKPGLF